MADVSIEHDENDDLVSSSKIDGTVVYEGKGEKLGTIREVMIDKGSDQVDYAVRSFGGPFGLGSNYYPIPWDMLADDCDDGGYVVDFEKDVLEKAPRYPASKVQRFDRAYDEQAHGYYGVDYPNA